MGKTEVLADLRRLTGSVELTEREAWKVPSFPFGVPKGVIVELIGNAHTEWLLELLKANPEPYVCWLEREPTLCYTRIAQLEIDLRRFKFVTAANDLQQPLRIALDSQQYPIIIAPTRFEDVKIFQRFSLLAEKAKATLFFIAKEKLSTAWPISLQLEIASADIGFKIDIHRRKYGPPL